LDFGYSSPLFWSQSVVLSHCEFSFPLPSTLPTQGFISTTVEQKTEFRWLAGCYNGDYL
jgi:hypothetical protein